ncbi:condensation domain-containing protein [Kutzneria sp. NPDC052558]|uniref:condensation domain-containing protein n=1 Tax=Kutzneria sp. NPDC052558 TaxID=3364121 RepID=UPI0037CBD6BC
MTASIDDVYTLAPLQQGLLLHALRDGDPGLFVNQLVCRLAGPVRDDTLERAFAAVVAHHPVLRTSFHSGSSEQPVQVVHRAPAVTVEHREVDSEAELARLLVEDRRRGFRLEHAPLTRLTRISLPDKQDVLLWTYHHLVLDGWSGHVVLNELLTAYDVVSRGREVRLPFHRPFRDYIAWLGRQDITAAMDCMRRRLKDLPGPTVLPASGDGGDHPRGEQTVVLSRERTRLLHSRARQAGITVNSLIHAGWGLVVSRYSGSPDVVFGTTMTVRPPELSGADGMVGVLLTTLPTRVRVDPDRSLSDWLADIHTAQLELQQHSHLPLSQALTGSGLPAGTALFDTAVVVENYPIDRSGWEHDSITLRHIDYVEQSNFSAVLVVVDEAEMRLGLAHDRGVFSDDHAGLLLQHLVFALESLCRTTDCRLADLPTAPAGSREPDLARPTHIPPDPDQLAVVDGERELTYRELERRSDHIRRWLVDQGARPGDRVEVRLPRGVDQVIAVLGVVKADCVPVETDPAVVITTIDIPAVDLAAEPPGETVARLRDLADRHGLTGADTVLAMSTASVEDVVMPLTVGATVVLDAPARSRPITALLGVAPHVWRTWDAPPGHPIRLVAFRGGRPDDLDAARVSSLFGPDTVLANQYRPAGCRWAVAVHVTTAGQARAGVLPAGRPVPDAEIEILDRTGNPVPPGAPGELWVGRERCATGRRWGDGTLELLDDPEDVAGRTARQLRGHPAVADAVAVGDADVIHAYVVPRGTPLPAPELVRWSTSAAGRSVTCTVVDALPLTATGDLDPARLPRTTGPSPTVSSAAERILTEIFAAVLDRPDVGPHDSFFELGGSSLAALRMMNQASEALGVELPLETLFVTPTVAGLLAAVPPA